MALDHETSKKPRRACRAEVFAAQAPDRRYSVVPLGLPNADLRLGLPGNGPQQFTKPAIAGIVGARVPCNG